MWQSLKISSLFYTLNLKGVLWKTQTFFKKLEYRFLVGMTIIENKTFPYKTALTESNVKTNRMWSTLSGKKVGVKWLNFLQVTKFFPHEIFPRLSLSRPVFFPDFFHLTKDLFLFFLLLLLLLLLLFPIYLQNLLLSCFFDVLYLSWLSKAVLIKALKCEWKQGIDKN